jgi:ABC-type Na+ transport system ATPase subunit NatA
VTPTDTVWASGLTKVYPRESARSKGWTMLTTRIVPTAGRAVVGGVDIVAEPARARFRFGVVSQATTLDRHLNARQNLVLHGRYFGMGGRAARPGGRRVARCVPPHEQAAGARRGALGRQLMLARAMVHAPDVLFLDEPTAGLDPQSRVALWEIVLELRALGRTIVVTTHYIEETDRYCDRVAIMDGGPSSPWTRRASSGARTAAAFPSPSAVTATAAASSASSPHFTEPAPPRETAGSTLTSTAATAPSLP